MNAQMRLLIMLTSVGVSGSLLFAAEPASRPETRDEKAAEPAPAASEQPADAAKAAPTAKEKAAKETSSQPAKTSEAQAKDAKAKETQAKEAQAREAEAKEVLEKAAQATEDQDPGPPPAATAADKAGSPQRFNPSEQVRADFDVSFPIDI